MNVYLHEIHVEAFLQVLANALRAMPELTVDEETQAIVARDHNNDVGSYVVSSLRNYFEQTETKDVNVAFSPPLNPGEIAVPVGDDQYMVFESYESNPAGCSYIRFINYFGEETLYEDHQEWVDEPLLTMGAICAAIVSGGGVHPEDDQDDL